MKRFLLIGVAPLGRGRTVNVEGAEGPARARHLEGPRDAGIDASFELTGEVLSAIPQVAEHLVAVDPRDFEALDRLDHAFRKPQETSVSRAAAPTSGRFMQ